MNDLSSALERLQVAFATPTPGLGAPGPAEEGDRDMGDADGTERATPPEEAQTPPTKRLKGFVAASQKATSQDKPVTLVPVDGKPGYFKLVDLPDLFPVLPASAATLLRDIKVEEVVSLFYKFVGKNLTEDLVIRILEVYVPMKIQLRQEEVWASQFQRNKACIAPAHVQARRRSFRLQVHVQGMRNGVKESAPFQAPSATYEGRHHLQPAHLGGQANPDPAAGMGKPGCRWPRWYPGTGRPQLGGRHGLGESPSKNGLG